MQRSISVACCAVPSSSRSEPSGVLRRKPQHRAEQHAKSQLDSNHTEASAALGKGKAKAKRGGQKQRKGKSARRVGLVNPTLEEMKTAFSLFNPHSGSVINAQDIARVHTSCSKLDRLVRAFIRSMQHLQAVDDPNLHFGMHLECASAARQLSRLELLCC